MLILYVYLKDRQQFNQFKESMIGVIARKDLQLRSEKEDQIKNIYEEEFKGSMIVATVKFSNIISFRKAKAYAKDIDKCVSLSKLEKEIENDVDELIADKHLREMKTSQRRAK